MPVFTFLQHTFEHSWEAISLAVFRKYPNIARPDVLSIDLISKELNEETGELRTKRLIVMDLGVPAWLKKIVGCSSLAYFVEEATINPEKKTMVLVAKNISLGSLIEMTETCTYTPHPEQVHWTEIKQQATVKAFYFGIANRVEQFADERFRRNAHKGWDLMEQTILKLKREAEESLNTVEQMGARLRQEAEGMTAQIKQEAVELGTILKEQAEQSHLALNSLD